MRIIIYLQYNIKEYIYTTSYSHPILEHVIRVTGGFLIPID